MKFRNLGFLVLACLVSACAQKPVKPLASQGLTDSVSLNSVPAQREIARPDLPNQTLNERILFEFLLGEIAAQRGNLEVASRVYLDLANMTRDPRIAQRATEIALYGRQHMIARQAAALWVELDPQNVRARQTLVALLITLGKLDEATPHLNKLLSDEGPNIGEGFRQLIGLLARHNEKPAVLSLIRKLAEPYPSLPEARFAVAQAALDAGEHELALQEIKAARTLRPDWDVAALLEAQILQRNSNAQALALLEDYLKKYPNARDVRLSYARLLVGEKNYAGARNEFRKLMSDFPDNAEIALAVGLLSMQLKDYDAAEATLKKVLNMEYKDHDTVRFYLGQINEERKRYDEAGRWYQAVSKGEQYLQAQMRYASVLAKMGKLAQAREHLQQFPAQNNQQRVQLILAEAQLLREAGKHRDAFILLERALEKLPNYPDLLYDYAMAAEKIDRLDILESNLRKLIQIKPDHAHAYNALGYSLADRTDRLQEARGLIQKALELAPDDPFIQDSMGWVEYRLGNIDAGVKYLRQAFDNRPDPEIAAHLGEVLWVQGNRDEARKIWQSALKEHPDNELLVSTVKKYLP